MHRPQLSGTATTNGECPPVGPAPSCVRQSASHEHQHEPEQGSCDTSAEQDEARHAEGFAIERRVVGSAARGSSGVKPYPYIVSRHEMVGLVRGPGGLVYVAETIEPADDRC